MKTLLWLACWFAIDGLALGDLQKAVEGKAEVELRFEKQQYYLGEPCQVEFVLRNTDDKEISYESGGDYRGAGRALRFRVQAVDAQGQPVPEADPAMCMGGIFGTHTLKQGEEWRQKLWPLDYLRLIKPGKYTVRITHDLGWCGRGMAFDGPNSDKSSFVPKDWKAPIGEARVEFLIPDEQQAQKVLDAISVELKKPENDESRRVPSPQDLALPVYLPLLKQRALAGEQYFLQALGEISTKEATLTLLELAENKAFPDAGAAAYLLSDRMPSGPNSQPDWNKEKRQRLIEAAWDESYTPRARAIALALVAGFNPDAPAPEPKGVSASGYFRNMVASEFKEADLGARILVGVGTAEDYETLRAALDKAFKLTLNARRGAEVNILDFPAPMPELIRALDALHTRGLELKSHSGDAAIYLDFHWMANTPPPRPKRWLESATAFADSRYPIQMAILESIPTPMPPECRDMVLKLLDARDEGTMMEACQVAGASGDKTTFLPEVLAIIRVEANEWLFRAAADAAAQLGARRQLAAALAERLTDEKLCPEALQRLSALAVENRANGGGSGMTRQERITAQEAWREWISAHGEDLEVGKKFQAGDDTHLPRALFARAIHWDLPNGKKWPQE
ncbi:MAG: hypothetical protein ACFUZC_10715 [Chthoniobacteraceae bacterium]